MSRDGDLAEDVDTEPISYEIEERIQNLKQEKAKEKSAFTRIKNKLLRMLDEQDYPSRREIKETCQQLGDVQERAIGTMSCLSTEYALLKDRTKRKKVVDEMDKLKLEFSEANEKAQEYLESRKDELSSLATDASENTRRRRVEEIVYQKSAEEIRKEEIKHYEEIHKEILWDKEALQELTREYRERLIEEERRRRPVLEEKFETRGGSSMEKPTLGRDMWNQLQRVSIPEFNGDKKTYEGWKAAFTACVHEAPATPEYKLLQLRQHLSGEALKVVEPLGHSAAAFEAALVRLERKFGGERRKIALQLEELENMKSLRSGNARDIERFADLLDIIVVNLKEPGRHDELGKGTLYISLCKKLNETMLTQYHRWIFEKSRWETVETLKEFVLQEAEFQTVASETIRGVNSPNKNSDSRRNRSEKAFFGYAEKSETPKFYRPCKVCNGHHGVWRCDKFKDLGIQERWNTAKRLNLCFRCLGEDHRGQTCVRSRMCGINNCRETHNRLLHVSKDRVQAERKQQVIKESTPDKTTTACDLPDSKSEPAHENEKVPLVLLPLRESGDQQVERSHTTTTIGGIQTSFLSLRTVPVIVKNGDRKVKVNALLDEASTKTYINCDVAGELRLQGIPRKVTVNVLNGQTETFETTPVDVEIESLDGTVKKTVSAFTTEKVTGTLEAIDWGRCARNWPHLRGIQFPEPAPHPLVDILIGIDQIDLHYSFKDVKGRPGDPIARLTPLGWTCVGPADGRDLQTNFTHTYFVREQREEPGEISGLLRRFWEIENYGTSTEFHVLTAEEKTALDKLEKSTKHINGRYQVAIPWRDDEPLLPDNYDMALRRLENTEKRLLKNPNIGKAYTDNIHQYLKKGYIRQVDPTEESPPNKWYLPHFPIVRPDRTTTKSRIVFDASAKFEGVSLNDTIHQGPKLQRELTDVLLRFRRKPVALMCDIAEMYLRIEVTPKDRPYQRFLWRSLNQERTPDQYEFNRVVFGVNCSPLQAQFVAQKHAEKYRNEFPMAAETVMKSTYMDDSMDSVVNDSQGIKLYQELNELWSKAGMQAHEWLSNSAEVLERIPPESRASEAHLPSDGLPMVKTLGVTWLPEEDVFTFKANPVGKDFPLTKRNFLKTIAKLFDPVGFLAPFIVRAKILLQEMWATGLDWDDLFQEDLASKARKWFSELEDLPTIKVPRCLRLGQEEELLSQALHTFVDASQYAYGAVIYSRAIYKSGTVSKRLVAAKTRVAPLKATSIPRLELMAAVIGLRMTASISKTLSTSLDQATLWSDSMNVLWWIRGRSQSFKPFVANRVGEIQTATDPKQWRYVPTNKNPADLLTRGLELSELIGNEKRWNGPDFLGQKESEWPVNQEVMDQQSARIEVKSNSDLPKQVHQRDEERTMMITGKDNQSWRLNPERFSSWKRFTRVHAWVNRFVDNCRVAKKECGELKPNEIEDSEVQAIRSSQREAFPEEYLALQHRKELPNTSKLLPLRPRLDEEGQMRCDGRLKYAGFLSQDARFPIILPRKHHVTKLIVKQYHEEGNHASGTNQTLAALSTRFWLISGREEIREWEKECNECRRRKAKAAKQIMAPLPQIRLRLSLRPFAQTAVDFAGPFITIQGRGFRRQKRYLCLFTCLATRAVNLEMAFGLDTDSFLNAFYRMVNRRGLPREMLSDNGTNFVAAERELRELVAVLDREKIAQSTANKGVIWHFNPPHAPHFGGVHETMIKAAKRAVNAVLGNADVTDEELVTAFTGAEALLNSRPLTYQSANPEDDIPLTPNHFLIGQIGGQFAPESVDDTSFSLKKRWRRVQELVRHFWHRWIREWIPRLNSRRKWFKNEKDLQTGDVVLVMSPDSPRGHWPLGRIIEIYHGKDGHVRVVKVQVGKKQLTRPISKLCPLELQ